MSVVLYICIIVFSVLQSLTTKYYNKQNDNSVAFNAIKALFAFILLGIMSMGGVAFHGDTVVYGFLYGISLCISMYSGYKALSLGPMSLTSLIVSFSVVIPLIYGIAFCDESVTPLKSVGLIFLIIAIVFTNVNKPKTAQSKETSYIKWLIFVLMTFVSNGACSVLQKMHQMKYPGMYLSEFMLFAMLLCTLVFAVIAAIKVSPKEFCGIRGKKFAVLSGIANALANYCTLALSGFENASVLYPAISAGTILMTLLCGMSLFKEKLRYNHWIAFAAGIAAVVFLKM